MRVAKQGSKGEGGRGFHHLFDWNSKPNKKLVSKIASLSVQPQQKASVDTNMQITQYHPVIEDYTTSSLILKGCTSSLIDEDDNGKSPGVVARLMGLDSFPTSNSFDTQSKSNRFFDTRSRQDSSALHVGKVSELEQKDNRQVEQKRNIIEKFQTESLPPKSARSVIITQHKLVSPIKSSGFVSLNDPTRIMEAASRIPLVGSTSVDVSNRKLSPTRPVESNAARKLKGQSMNKSWDGCLEQKDGKKSVSLAIQAKVNVKKRQGFTLNGAKSPNNQPVGEKNTLKKPATNKVLKPNNKKQNCVPDRVKSPAKSSASSMHTQSRKPVFDKRSVAVIPANKTVDRRKRLTEDVKNKGDAKQDRNGKIAAKSNGMDVISFTFTSPISRSTDKINRNSLSSATGGGSLSTLLDQQLRELTAMSPASVYHESRITRTIIFQDKRNQDGTSKDAQVAGQEFGAVFSTILTKTEADPESFGNESERVYIKNILTNIESMFEDFTLNRTSKIVNPHLFDQLEAQKPVFDKKHETKLRRKLVFDCVSECVDSRCAVWLRGLAVVTRKDRLVEDVCNKVNEWEQMKDCMVDELVDKDMSCGQHKKWLDFDLEAFEIGVEIEGRLLGSLIDEAIVDMLVS
ncbi:hypothetical protein HanRHA438_Chr01g0045351 [Helianthus annuus]|uniref:DUF4378 domain-containing protein n=1 Tax=Helianthus annuus TaxID=4232 RepID=A0A9K3JYC0_HELAN|nr:uncharacterized protein LOC118481090 [Helianthus annuus]XP_035832084.1 uncharacterized protein LOC118481090 [Helianthus annuus]KAF5824006.1 hypothetical protein HanXRQr2_Chr01g0044411 [Helianthus annuus]KAJ0950070.1 hypothetical protein HanRHA438_Chr01g0045351 [Helianthus annuus]